MRPNYMQMIEPPHPQNEMQYAYGARSYNENNYLVIYIYILYLANPTRYKDRGRREESHICE